MDPWWHKEVIGEATLYLGDCREILPALPKVDAVITDPPYEAEAHRQARRQSKGPNMLAEDYEIPFAQITPEFRTWLAAACGAVSSGWCLYFCQVEGVHPWREAIEAAGGKWRRAGIWVKPDSAPQFTGDRWAQGYECIAAGWHGVGKSRWNARGKRGVYTALVNDYGRKDNEHPTAKPIRLMNELIADYAPISGLILDPMMGGGSTGIACMNLGRKFIGIEIEPRYFDIACRRIDDAQRQGRLFA